MAKIVRPIILQLQNLSSCKDILNELEQEVENLNRRRESRIHEVEAGKRDGEVIEDEAVGWLNKVDKILQDADKLLKASRNANAGCFPNLKSQHQLGRKARKLTAHIHDLSAVKFDHGTKRHRDELDSKKWMKEIIVSTLKKPDRINKIGIYGLEGVGDQTTLVKTVTKTVEDDKLFDRVIMARVSKALDVDRIQCEIADQLGFSLKEMTSERGGSLNEILKKEKSIFIIFYDIEGKIDLEKLGIPLEDHHKGCKLLLISRNEHILQENEIEKMFLFRLKFLNDAELWSLCQTTPGAGVNEHDEKKILELTNHSSLERICNELEDKVLQIFLLCGVYGKSILVSDLFKYIVGLGLFKHINSIDDARNELKKIFGVLKASFPTLVYVDDKEIQMNGLLRDIAKKVASENAPIFTMERNVPLKDWPSEDSLRKCTQIILGGNHNIQKLPQRLDCPNLELLHLDSSCNRTLKIPDSFFKGMTNLQVLDLIGMVIQPELPASLVSLTKLKTLCFNACYLGSMSGIGALRNLEILSFCHSSMIDFPNEIGHLAHLRMLDLMSASEIEVSILQNILSNLTELEELCMENLYIHDQLIIDSLKKLSAFKAKSCGQSKCLFLVSEDIKLSLVDIEVSECGSMKNIVLLDSGLTIDKIESIPVRSLTLQHLPELNGFCCNDSEVLDIPTLFPDKEALFRPLKHLKVVGISRILLLVITALSNGMVPLQNLETLEIVGCNDLQYLFVIKGLKMYGNYSGLLPDLHQLRLCNLVKLRSIVGLNHPRDSLSFKMLKDLIVCSCNQLRYVLPLYVLQNLHQLENIVINDCKMLEWVFGDDEEDKLTTESNENTAAKNTVELPQVNSLILEELPKFTGFCQGGCLVKWLSLKKIRLVECPMIKKSSLGMIDRPLLTSVEVTECNAWAKHEALESKIVDLFELTAPLQNLETLEIVGCNHLQYLFVIKGLNMYGNYSGLLPDLHQLRLRNLVKLRSIVGLNHPRGTLSFKMLKDLIVCSCNQLRYVLPLYVLQNLHQLENIVIIDCKMLEWVFGDEDEDKQITKSNENRAVKNTVELLQVNSLILEELPKFTRCRQDGCLVEWLSLKKIRLVECPMIKKSSLGMIDRSLLTSVEVTECNIWAKNEPLENKIDYLFEFSKLLFRLEELRINDSEELKKYMEMELQESSFTQLKTLEARQCNQELVNFLSLLLGRSDKLKELKVENCQQLEHVFNLTEIEFVGEEHKNPKFPNLETMQLLRLPKLTCIWNKDPRGIVELGKLVKLEIFKCGLLKSLLSTALVEKLVYLEELKIESCEMIEQVVEGDDTDTKGRSFPNLKDLQLGRLPKLTKFNSGHYNLTFPNLHSLWIEKCPELNALTIGFLSKTTNEGTSYHVLPNEMDTCSKLERLKLVGHESFEEIWQGHVCNIPDCELKKVEVDSFTKLRYIFPSSKLQILLEKLETLVVRNCTSLSDVFQIRDNDSIMTFQNLTVIRVKGCDSLQHLLLPFRYHKLTEIDISDCQSLQQVFIDTKIKADEKSFPDLKSIVLENLPMLSNFSLETFEFPKLEKARIVNCPAFKTFSRNVSARANNIMDPDSSQSLPFGHGKTILMPELKVLELSDLPKMQLWNQEPQIPVFKNLASLKIIGCGSIDKLFSISVARHHSSLKFLTLYKCENMVQVLQGGGGYRTKVFQKLETLVLKHLPRLSSFCEDEDVDFGEFPELRMVRVEDIPKMYTFVKKSLKTPKLKQVHVIFIRKCWQGNLNDTITYLQQNHEKMKVEAWESDQTSTRHHTNTAESSFQGKLEIEGSSGR